MKLLTIFLIFISFLSTLGSASAANEDIKHDKNLLEELGKYYHNEFGAEQIIIKLDSSKLKHGDYIQLRDFEEEAFMYLLKDNNGYIYFH